MNDKIAHYFGRTDMLLVSPVIITRRYRTGEWYVRTKDSIFTIKACVKFMNKQIIDYNEYIGKFLNKDNYE